MSPPRVPCVLQSGSQASGRHSVPRPQVCHRGCWGTRRHSLAERRVGTGCRDRAWGQSGPRSASHNRHSGSSKPTPEASSVGMTHPALGHEDCPHLQPVPGFRTQSSNHVTGPALPTTSPGPQGESQSHLISVT